MTNKHTPGPWRIGHHSPHFDAFIIETPCGDYQVTRHPQNTSALGTSEGGANARLIAAAPELLAALCAIRDGFADSSIKFTKKRQSDNDPYHPANILLTAAIRKATGELGPTCPECGRVSLSGKPFDTICANCAEAV